MQRRQLLVAIHNQHYIYETLVWVIENPGLITKREIDCYGNPQAVGCHRCRSIDFFSKQMMVTTSESNPETIYRGSCTPNDCREADSLYLALGGSALRRKRKSRK